MTKTRFAGRLLAPLLLHNNTLQCPLSLQVGALAVAAGHGCEEPLFPAPIEKLVYFLRFHYLIEGSWRARHKETAGVIARRLMKIEPWLPELLETASPRDG